MEEIVASTYQQDRILSRLLTLFAAMALLLAVLGVYGVMAYNVTQRTQEVGVRLAIGAREQDILRLMMRQGAWLACLGIGAGLVLAFVASRFLASFLFGVGPRDPATFAVVSLVLLAAALAASLFPALRAARVDPLTALRAE